MSIDDTEQPNRKVIKNPNITNIFIPLHSNAVPLPSTSPVMKPFHNRISFSHRKTKKSKIKYLTTNELIGICLSVLLSFSIALTSVYFLTSLSPVIFSFILQHLSINSQEEFVINHNPIQISTIFQPQKDIRLAYFIEKYYMKKPLLFENYHMIADEYLTKSNRNLWNLIQHDSNLMGKYFNVLKLNQVGMNNGSDKLIKLNDFFSNLNLDKFESTYEENFCNDHLFLSDKNFYRNYIDMMNYSKQKTHELYLPFSKEELLSESSRIMQMNHMNTTPYSHCNSDVTISIGKNNSLWSGTSFHSHGESYNELLKGQKQWAIYSPSKLPKIGFHPNHNLQKWLEDVYPLLPVNERPIEFIQEIGQIVYTPEGWYHATKTISDISISISYNPSIIMKDQIQKISKNNQTLPTSSHVDQRNSFYHYLLLGHDRFDNGDYLGASKMLKVGLSMERDLNILNLLGKVLENLKLYEEAEDIWRELIDQNPRDPRNYAQLVNFLVTYSSKDMTHAVSELLEKSALYHIRHEVLQLISDYF